MKKPGSQGPALRVQRLLLRCNAIANAMPLFHSLEQVSAKEYPNNEEAQHRPYR